MSSPSVFISYSHDSPEHVDRVLKLADRLVAEGLEVILDQYEPAPPEGWPRWMDKRIRDSKRWRSWRNNSNNIAQAAVPGGEENAPHGVRRLEQEARAERRVVFADPQSKRCPELPAPVYRNGPWSKVCLSMSQTGRGSNQGYTEMNRILPHNDKK